MITTTTYLVRYANGSEVLMDSTLPSRVDARLDITRRARSLNPWTKIVLIRPLRAEYTYPMPHPHHPLPHERAHAPRASHD